MPSPASSPHPLLTRQTVPNNVYWKQAIENWGYELGTYSLPRLTKKVQKPTRSTTTTTATATEEGFPKHSPISVDFLSHVEKFLRFENLSS